MEFIHTTSNYLVKSDIRLILFILMLMINVTVKKCLVKKSRAVLNSNNTDVDNN